MVNKSQNNDLPVMQHITFEQMNIITNSNKLWMEFAYWVRALIYSTIKDPERQQFIANKLFEGVAAEFYTLFEFYYGTQLAQRFMNLFTNFITGIWRISEELKNNNPDQVNAYTAQLYETVDSLAKFLAQINLYYQEDQWRYLLFQAVKLAIDETTSILSNNFQKEIEVSSSMADLSIMLGNYMAGGIISGSMPEELKARNFND